MPAFGDLPNISSGVTNEGAPPKAPSTEPLQREMPQPQSPLHPVLKSLVDKSSSRFPKRGPYAKRDLSPEPEDGRTAGFRNSMLHLKVRQQTKTKQKKIISVRKYSFVRVCGAITMDVMSECV
jgi:hypothetical protein